MKIFKRNQIIILVIALMLITAGYLNYTSTNNIVDNNSIASTDETLGDAALVSANVYEENDLKNEITNETNLCDVSNEINTIETIAAEEEQYFINSKLERTAMYSELLETYQELYNNTSATAEEKKDALEKINEINSIKNSIMIAENLISAKGIKDIVIFANENSISVVVGEDEITQEQIAQIQNIVSRELNVDAGNIHISSK